MLNHDAMAQYLANEEQLNGIDEMCMHLSITRYMKESITYHPHLATANILAYRDYVQRNIPRLVSEEAERKADLTKCNVRASIARKEANKLVIENRYRDALEKYNESICWAKSDSENLAIVYGDRAALYYEHEEYEFAMVNLTMAKEHNYPDRLMPKLLAMEFNCKSKIEAGEHISSKQLPKLDLNVDLNPRIPFLANGIVMKELPHFGRSMVAEKDFQAGDVILSEKPIVISFSSKFQYSVCQHCSSENFMSLIPCPQCVSVMYCSKECLKNDWRLIHRFECGIYDKLKSIPFDGCHMGPKVFFYGLTMFNDDVKRMMKYCKSYGRTGSNPFDLDYTKEDSLAAFKVFHMAKIKPHERSQDNFHRFIAAIFYNIYIQQPLVRSLFATQAQKNFLLTYIFQYSTVINRLTVVKETNFMYQLHTVAALCNHSCDPNTHAMFYAGQLTFVVIRPISKGEQICISYGPIWGDTSFSEQYNQLAMFEVKCACEVCYPNSFTKWLNKSKLHPPSFCKDEGGLRIVLNDDTLSNEDKMNALREFIQRYASVHPLTQFQPFLGMYREVLTVIFENEFLFTMRKKALASLN